jgi:hypothetical protein
VLPCFKNPYAQINQTRDHDAPSSRHTPAQGHK